MEYLEAKVLQEAINKVEGSYECYMSIDPGSRSTRLLEHDKDMSKHDPLLILDSSYNELSAPLANTRATSACIGDNLEINITDKKEGVSRIIVKEDLFHRAGGEVMRASGSSSKVQQPVTYINIISAITVKLLHNITQSGELHEKYIVRPTVALRPDDKKSLVLENQFREKLSGEYTIEMIRYGITLNISIEDVVVDSEAEATMRYLVAHKGNNDSSTILVVDCGGSSTDISTLIDSRLKDNGHISVGLGGTNLSHSLGDNIVASGKLNKIHPSVAEVAMTTGYVKSGKKQISIIKELKDAKLELAKNILNHMQDTIAVCRKYTTDIEEVVFAGNVFGATAFENEKSPSLGTYIMKMYKKSSPDTEFSVVDIAYPIPYGLAYYRATL